MTDSILHSVILLSILGTTAGLVLYVVSKRFYVYENPLIAELEEILPAANCGGCGSPGCKAFAEKLVASEDISDLFCPVGGNEVMKLGFAIYFYSLCIPDFFFFFFFFTTSRLQVPIIVDWGSEASLFCLKSDLSAAGFVKYHFS